MRGGGDRSPRCHRPHDIRLIDMLFLSAKEPTSWRGTANCKEEKSYLPMSSTYFHLRSACTCTGCISASMTYLKQSAPVSATLTTALLTWIHRGSGMNVLPRKGSNCHNVNCNDWKSENTHPDPFNSNTSMKFNSCRLNRREVVQYLLHTQQ